MGFNLTAFAGGFASALSEDIEKEEKLATLRGQQGVENMMVSYKKTIEDNRKIKNELESNIATLRSYDESATEAELAALASNKHVMDRVLSHTKDKDFDANSFKIADVVKVAGDNSTSTALERLSSMFTVQAQATKEEAAKPSGGFIRDLIATSGSKAEEYSAREAAKSMGVTLEELKAAKAYTRAGAPEMGAKYNMAAFNKQPQNVKDITDKLEVEAIQAAQKFGENSPQVLAIQEKKATVTRINKEADKSPQARADRLNIAILDSKDPAEKKSLQIELAKTQDSIKLHNQLTRVKDPKEKEEIYSKMKISINDYVTSRLKDDRGVDWGKYVDFKTFTDPATGITTQSRTQKETLNIEKQRELFDKERQLALQALKANGYTTADGTPRTPVAEQYMRNFNISASDLADKSVTPEQPLPIANAPKAQPNAVPQINRQDQDALVWANNPANAGPKADAIKKKIQNKINGTN